MASDPGPRRRSGGFSRDGLSLVLPVAFLAGFACLAVEFAIVRLCAPWFGQGTHVWANTVAVVLSALALGYGMGGRLADRGGGTSMVVGLLVFGALWLTGAAHLGAELAQWLAPASIGADRPHPLSLFGSLAGTAVLAGPPLLVMGALTPILVAFRATRSTAGRASGLVGASGTLGGLLGCALVPMALVPAFGSRGVLLVAAAALGIAAWLLSVVDASDAGPVRRSTPPSDPSDPSEVGAPASRGAVTWALVAAFACGVALTLVEFATLRRLAPRFGSDIGTWAVTIGTILAMSVLGSAFGLSRRWLLAFAVVWITLAGLHGVSTGPGDRTTLGLVGHALVSGLGVYHLAAVPPLLVQALSRRGRVGRCVSSIYGVSTLGNVLGCYLAPLALLPVLGTRATFFVAAGLSAVGVVATWFAGGGRVPATGRSRAAIAQAPASVASVDPAASASRRTPRWVALATLAVTGLSAFAIGGPLRRDPGQREEVETAYSTIRVVERTEAGPAPGPAPLLSDWTASHRGRFLGFDEDTTSYQSVRLSDDENTALTGGRYYEHLALGAWFAGQPWTRPDGGVPRVLIVGYCGGSLHRVLSITAPADRAPRVTGIEIDPRVVELARKHLGALPPGLELHVGVDGRAAMAALPAGERFDLILVDAYQRTQYVPFHLSTVEFFEACRRRLTPNGALGINSDSEMGAAGRLVRCLAESVAEAFDGRAWLVPNALYPGNVAIWGTNDVAAPRVASGVDPRLETAAFCLDRFLVRYLRGAGGAFVLTDDRAPTEWLADDALLHVEDGK